MCKPWRRKADGTDESYNEEMKCKRQVFRDSLSAYQHVNTVLAGPGIAQALELEIIDMALLPCYVATFSVISQI